MLVGGFLAAATRHHERVAAAGTLAAAAVIALLAAHAVPAGAAGALACIAGFAIGTVAPSRDMLVRAATPPGATGRASGIVYAGVDVGAALGPAIIGAWLDRNLPEAAYASASVALLVTALLGLDIARRARRLSVSAAVPEEPSR
jgi:MFS family permease